MKCLNHGVTSRQGKAVCCSSVPSSLRSSAPVFPLLSPAALRDHTTKMSHQTGIQGKAPIHLFGNVRRCLDDAVCRKKKNVSPTTTRRTSCRVEQWYWNLLFWVLVPSDIKKITTRLYSPTDVVDSSQGAYEIEGNNAWQVHPRCVRDEYGHRVVIARSVCVKTLEVAMSVLDTIIHHAVYVPIIFHGIRPRSDCSLRIF